MAFFANLGRRVTDCVKDFEETMSIFGETVVSSIVIFFRPDRFRFRDSFLAFQRAAFDGLPIALGIGLLLGIILAFQSAAALKTFGVEVYVADLLAIGLFRELGPLVTAIILAGRSGSAFAAEIGTMKVNEEIDALTTMGLKPVRFLILPRVAAVIWAMPILTVFSELAGLVGGAIVLQIMGVPTTVFWSHVISTSTLFMIAFGLGKAALFGLLVGLIGCSSGLKTKSTADGVGVAATAAVVGGIVAIAIADGILAVVCYVWNL